MRRRLEACPSQDESITEERLIEIWNCFRQLTPEHGDTITPAVVVGLILYDEQTFGRLLTPSERTQLTALGQVALERYQARTNPRNPLGRTIAATIKETT